MNCKRAQAQVALAVGGDLDDAAERELHEHLGGCVDCHRHWKQMSDTWAMLLDREDELPDPHDSVWPDLQVKLPNRRELMSRARFNGWTVALAVSAVCLAMVSMWQTANTPEPGFESAVHDVPPPAGIGTPPQPVRSPFEPPGVLDVNAGPGMALPGQFDRGRRERLPVRWIESPSGGFYLFRR